MEMVQEKYDPIKVGTMDLKVYQVDDSPRYEGSASWVHIKKSFGKIKLMLHSQEEIYCE